MQQTVFPDHPIRAPWTSTQTDVRELYFRRSGKPAVRLPFGVRSVGVHRIGPGYREYPRQKDILQVFWTVQGEGMFRIKDEMIRVRARTVFALFPGQVHDLRPITSPWHYRWITVDGPLAAEIVRGFAIDSTPRRTGPCPEELFSELQSAVQILTPRGERESSALAYRLFSLATEESTSQTGDRYDPLVTLCMTIVEQSHTDPEFTVSRLAAEAGVHRNTVTRVFQRQLGISAHEYIFRRRVHDALALLKRPDLNISQVAHRAGFRGGNYLAKVVRQTFGATPSLLRKEIQGRSIGQAARPDRDAGR